MCGITGYIAKSGEFFKENLTAINSRLSHRGPDEEGYYIHNNVGLGHKRLSIIDLKSGQQPMCNDDGSLVISYNGELYNFKELRNQLNKKGYTFNSTSDTEVILKCYEHYGNNCVKYFRGMFAFAIINKIKQEIFIARDHLGIKPLVYYQDSDTFAWASEIQALKGLSNFVKDIDFYAIDQYLKLQYIPAPRTVYRKIKKLLPGHYMVVNFKGDVIGNKPYWDLEFKTKKKSEQQWIQKLEQELKNSVKLHTVADVDFGAFLSGGIDSTLVVKYMSEILGNGINTYTIGFKGSEVNETPYADQVAKKYKTRHTQVILEGNALEVLPHLVKHYGEPFGDFSAIPTFYVSQLAGKDVKMVLSGDGADEIFAGYSHYGHWYHFINSPNNQVYFESKYKEWLYPIAHQLHKTKYPQLTKPSDEFSNYMPYRSRLSSQKREQLWRPLYKFLIDLPDELELKYKQRFLEHDEFRRAQYFDVKIFMPDDILTKVDIASMMNSLEVRTPITDKHIFELAATIPLDLLLYQNQNHNRPQGKYILKQLLANDFDDGFIHRKKQGFEIPLGQWLFTGDNYEAIKKRFFSTDGILNQLFNPKVLQQLLDEQDGFGVWLLLVLDEWFRQNE